MVFLGDLALAGVSLYIFARLLQAYSALRSGRMEAYALGLMSFALSLVLEAAVDIYVGLSEAPPRQAIRQAAPLLLLAELLRIAGLAAVAVAVTPTSLYALPPLLLLASVSAVLSAYVGALLLVRSLEGRGSPWMAAAFLTFAVSLAFAPPYPPPVYAAVSALRLAAAVLMAVGVTHAEAKA